jgi:hypothetical protein
MRSQTLARWVAGSVPGHGERTTAQRIESAWWERVTAGCTFRIPQ